MGTKNVTPGGRDCQRWDSQTPHTHSWTSIDRFPDTTTLQDVSNFCRNGRNDDGPWCFTTDPNTVWEYCDIVFLWYVLHT